MKKITPFSNASEACSWLDQNCDVCRRTGCSAKTAIQRGFISGEITERMAFFVGYTTFENEFESLFPECEKFTTIRVKPKKKQTEASLLNRKMAFFFEPEETVIF